MTQGQGNKKELKGVIVGNKMQNTVRVQVDTPQSHPVYKKVVNKRTIFFAHTEKELNIGDEVIIRESKPYSKNVKWIVINE
ncbi:TPA: 30S ribosomal protein S17 [Patescibacteria group bacterium]|nr:30S ribosomal protein S17 [Patescibacteria group bacterium]